MLLCSRVSTRAICLLTLAAVIALNPPAILASDQVFASVSGYLSGGVSFLNPETGVESTIPVPAGTLGATRTPSGNALWMLFATGVNVLDLKTQKLTTIPLDFPPASIVFNSTGTRAYVSGLDDVGRFQAPWVAVINVPAQTVLAQVIFDAPYSPGSMALSPDGSTLYLGTGVSVLVINAKTLAMITSITFSGASGYPFLGATGPYLVVGFNNEVAVVDTSTNAIVDSVPVANLTGLVISPDGATAYVLTYAQVAAYTVQGTIETIEIPSLQIENSSATFTPSISTGFAGMTISPDGTRLITNSFPLVLVDTATLALLKQTYPVDLPLSVQFGAGNEEVSVVFGVFGGLSEVVAVDPSTGVQLSQILVGLNANFMTTNDSRTLIFVVAGDESGFPQPTTIIDAATHEVVETTPVSVEAVAGAQIYAGLESYNFVTGATTPLPPPHVFGSARDGYFLAIYGSAASPNGTLVYVNFDNYLLPIGRPSYTGPSGIKANYSDSAPATLQRAQAGLAVYEAATSSLVGEFALQISGSFVFSPDSSIGYVPGTSNSQTAVFVVDNHKMKIVATWTFPQSHAFGAMLMSPDGSTIYAYDGADIVTIDTATGQLGPSEFPAPGSPTAISTDGSTLYFASGTTLSRMSTEDGSITSVVVPFNISGLVVTP